MPRVALKKINPRRCPATQADVNKAKDQAFREAVLFAWSTMMMALVDKRGATKEDVAALWEDVEAEAQSIIKGYAKVPDYIAALRDECDIDLHI